MQDVQASKLAGWKRDVTPEIPVPLEPLGTSHEIGKHEMKHETKRSAS